MSDVEIRIDLDRPDLTYRPGDEISGEYEILPYEGRPAKAVEFSVMWYTEGKGDEDFGVHFFKRWSEEDGTNDICRPHRFTTQLPQSPLSYDGMIVKIHWCARVRLFIPRRKEIVEDLLFRLGDIPSPAPLTPAEPS